jgi:nicotinamide phosphoribosyltransferase
MTTIPFQKSDGFSENLLLLTDSYKGTHWWQYPQGTEEVESYLESRGGFAPKVLNYGGQYIRSRYLCQRISHRQVKEANDFFTAHIGPGQFNLEGWNYIVEKHDGFLPLEIKEVPEGTLVPTHNVLMTVRNTDKNTPWLTNYVETILMQVWYPITVATLSYEMRKLISKYLKLTGDESLIDFKLHDFGFRGVSSVESAAIGGSAHLLNFKGTDTIPGILLANTYYKAGMAGFSIPAAEHSTITSWGKDHEVDAYRNMIQRFKDGLVAVVSDSYDLYSAIEHIWGEMLHDDVIKRNGTLVVRPDSGYPPEVVVKSLELLGQKFGYTTNNKGYKVLDPHVRLIQGDGIDYDMTRNILHEMKQKGWSTDNVAFGMGGALLQKINRDTQRFAFKACSVTVNGVERPVFKQPATDKGKASKAGKLALVKGEDGELQTILASELNGRENLLRTVYLNGRAERWSSWDSIRERITY